MKTPFTLLSLVPTLLVSLNLQAHETLSHVKGFNLVTCNQEKKCLSLSSSAADSGSISPIMTVKDFKLEITGQKKPRSLSGPFAYYDIQENKLVVTETNGHELEINLKDLSEKQY